MPEAALEAYEAALSSACATVGFFRDHKTGDLARRRREAGRRQTNRRSSAALALAAGLSGVAVPAAADADPGGRLAGAILCLVSRTTDRPTLRRARNPSARTGQRRAGSP